MLALAAISFCLMVGSGCFLRARCKERDHVTRGPSATFDERFANTQSYGEIRSKRSNSRGRRGKGKDSADFAW